MPFNDSKRLPACLLVSLLIAFKPIFNAFILDFRCSPGYGGLRCENLILRASEFESDSYSLDKTTKWILIAVIPVAIILIICLALFIGVFTFRIRKRYAIIGESND